MLSVYTDVGLQIFRFKREDIVVETNPEIQLHRAESRSPSISSTTRNRLAIMHVRDDPLVSSSNLREREHKISRTLAITAQAERLKHGNDGSRAIVGQVRVLQCLEE